ncbi:hypothetical protein C0991_008413 [Blastosporella zonata]|nr:hypothetical protein C0991_008413 [Blastosporella zonata]
MSASPTAAQAAALAKGEKEGQAILYGKSMTIVGILGVIMAAEFAVHTYTLTRVFPAPSPAPGVTVPCIAIGPTNWLVAFWALPLVFDTLSFGLTLYKSIQHWRNEVKSTTLSLLFRDGLVYFAAIFSMNLINVVLFVTQDETLQAINLPSTLMLNIIMSCRLILNLRKPRNVIASGNSAAAKKNLPMWQAPEKPRPSHSFEHSQNSSRMAIITNTDTVQTYV